MIAKLIGAPPAFFPEGSISHNNSPIPTTIGLRLDSVTCSMVFLLKTTFVLIDTAKVYHRYKYNDNYSYKINHTSYIKDLFSRDNNRRYPYVTSVQAASLQRLYKLGWRYIINRFKAFGEIGRRAESRGISNLANRSGSLLQ